MQTVMFMEAPFSDTHWIEVFNPETTDPEYWKAKVLEYANENEKAASVMRVRKGSRRYRRKLNLLDQATRLKESAKNINERMKVHSNGTLIIDY